MIGLAGCAVLLSGCSEKEAQQTQAPIARTPPPPPPEPVKLVPSIEDLMARLGIDERVKLPEADAPDTEEARIAILEFFDALARGDSAGVGSMLPLTEKMDLDDLVETGVWEKTTAQIQQIDIQTGQSPAGDACTLAMVYVGEGYDVDYQLQLWYYTGDAESFIFEAAPTPPGILDQLSGDWIAAWHELLRVELALADAPDEEYEIVQRRLDQGSSGGVTVGGGSPGGPSAPSPGSPSSPSKRPKKPKRKAPGPP